MFVSERNPSISHLDLTFRSARGGLGIQFYGCYQSFGQLPYSSRSVTILVRGPLSNGIVVSQEKEGTQPADEEKKASHCCIMMIALVAIVLLPLMIIFWYGSSSCSPMASSGTSHFCTDSWLTRGWHFAAQKRTRTSQKHLPTMATSTRRSFRSKCILHKYSCPL